MSEDAAPIGGRFLNRWTWILLGIAGLGFMLVAWRFAVGLGPSTAMSDGYPWGLWITFDVVTGTALACGGYAVALLVYVLNRGQYHPLVRPAILASALGYSLAGLSIAIDVGRPWYMYRIPLSPALWNLNSALLEVALCVMAYVLVMWIELSPAFFERWKEGPPGLLRNLSTTLHPILDKMLLWVIALGLLLPTMHQSSLGTVMILTGDKLHPLWQTPLLPLLFLIGCVTLGYSLVVFESLLSSQILRRRAETDMLAGLWRAASYTALAFVVVRLVDIAWRGQIATLLAFDRYTMLFAAEIVLMLVPTIMYFRSKQRDNRGELLQSALLFITGGVLYRFSAYLFAFNPGDGWSYFPAVPEILITAGLVATEVLLYIAIVKYFPILTARQSVAPAH